MPTKTIIKFVIQFGIILSLASCATSNFQSFQNIGSFSKIKADTLLAPGLTKFQQGKFAKAAVDWQQAVDLYAKLELLELYVEAALRLAEAYQRLGYYAKAEKVLKGILTKAKEGILLTKKMVAVWGSLGQVHFLLGHLKEAQADLENSIQLAKQTQQPALEALGLLHLGTVMSAQQIYFKAQAYFNRSIQLAQQNSQPVLAIKGLMNRIPIWLATGKKQLAKTQLVSLLPKLQALADSHEKVYLLIKWSEFAQPLGNLKLTLKLALQTAIEIAQAIDDHYALSLALGQLGYFYEQTQQYQQALSLTQRARFMAQQIQATHQLYRWEWQVGRLFKAQADFNPAISAYRRSVDTIEQLRLIQQDSTNACQVIAQPSFAEEIAPVFLGLADLLLQRSTIREDSRQRDRRAARDVVEKLKERELKNYFADECVTAFLRKNKNIEHIAPATAIIYPIVFAKRLELLLSLPHQDIQQFSVAVTKEQLQHIVHELRLQLEDKKFDDRHYLKYAQQLYSWLIQPLIQTLEKHHIHTLVIVPENILRTISLAALHDGKQFLIEQYALAITPSMILTEPHPHHLAKNTIPVLLNGLTETNMATKAQGFSVLPSAAEELKRLKNLYPKKYHSLEGKDFISKNIANALASYPYKLLHITSHAQFTSNPQETFIVTYNDKLTIDKLEQLIKVSKYREEPLELLTLNACETAKGDERAALGLSGVAIKAGARSALATLWKVPDNAAFFITTAFYTHLKQPSISKAQALQEAQKEILASGLGNQHPHYWAAFVLIGNWL